MLGPIKHLDCNSWKLTNTKSQTNSIQSTLILLFGQTPAPVDIVDIPSFTVCDYIWIILNWLTGFDPSTMHSPLDDFFVPCGSAVLPLPFRRFSSSAAPGSCGAGTLSGSSFFNPHEPRQRALRPSKAWAFFLIWEKNWDVLERNLGSINKQASPTDPSDRGELPLSVDYSKV